MPEDGPTWNLPPGIGAVEYWLQAATKTNQTIATDIVIAYETLSGLSLGSSG
jgi:hypothetical protein